MRYLPVVTGIIWLTVTITDFFLPSMLSLPVIRYALTILIGIFLPICFWQLNQQGKKAYGLLFILILVINSALLVSALIDNQEQNVTETERESSLSGNALIEAALEGPTAAHRRAAAHLFYRQQGVALVYQAKSGQFSRFVPAEADIHGHNRVLIKRADREQATLHQELQRDHILLLLGLQPALFLLLLIYLVYRETGAERAHISRLGP